MPSAHLPVHLLPDRSRNLGHVVWRSDSAEDFLQLPSKPGSALGELQSLFVNVGTTLKGGILHCILDPRNILITTMNPSNSRAHQYTVDDKATWVLIFKFRFE